MKNPEKKFLLFGASGLVGSYFHSLLKSKKHEVIGTAYSKNIKDLVTLDITNFEQVKDLINLHKPDVICQCINLSGGVNLCEEDKVKANLYHFEVNKLIADICKERGIKFVFISTDYVFSDSETEIAEEQTKSPLNFYGQLKSKIEDYIITELKNYLIIRTTNIYGWDPGTRTPNFFMQVYKSLKDGTNLKMPKNAFCTPTNVEDLVGAIFGLIEDDKSGVFHIVGDEFISRYDWARSIKECFGGETKAQIEEIVAGNEAVKRPLKLKLDTSKIKNTLSHWSHKKLHQVYSEIQTKINKENI